MQHDIGEPLNITKPLNITIPSLGAGYKLLLLDSLYSVIKILINKKQFCSLYYSFSQLKLMPKSNCPLPVYSTFP